MLGTPVILARFRANPLIIQTLRQRVHITPRRIFILIVALITVDLISLVQSLQSPYANFTGVFMYITGLLLIVNPMFVALTAATVAVEESKTEQHEMIFLSTLSNRKLVESHLFNTFYRCRLPLAIMVSLIPSLLIGLSLSGYDYYQYSTCVYYGGVNCVLPSVSFPWLLANSVVAFAFVCLNLLGAGLGQTLGLWWRQKHLAGGASAIIVTSVVLMLVYVLPSINALIESLRAMVASLILIGVSLGLLTIAETQARRPI